MDRYLSFLLPFPPTPVSGRVSLAQSTDQAADTRIRTFYLTLLYLFFQETASRDDCLQHRVHGFLRDRARHFTHSPMVASGVVEYWDMHVHDLDSTCLPRSLRGFHRVEREYHQLGTSVV